MTPQYERALIIGAGSGLSAALARTLNSAGLAIGLAARDAAKLGALAAELNAVAHPCDAAQPGQVDALFAKMDADLGGPPDVVIYNAGARIRGPLIELNRVVVAVEVVSTTGDCPETVIVSASAPTLRPTSSLATKPMVMRISS